jgi:hypothetical protein
MVMFLWGMVLGSLVAGVAITIREGIANKHRIADAEQEYVKLQGIIDQAVNSIETIVHGKKT